MSRWSPGQAGLGTGRKQLAGPGCCCATGAGFLVRGASPSSEGEVAAYGHQPSHHTVHHPPVLELFIIDINVHSGSVWFFFLLEFIKPAHQ